MKLLSMIIICSLLPLSLFANEKSCNNKYPTESGTFACYAAVPLADLAPEQKKSVATEQFSQLLIESVTKNGRRYEFIDEGVGIGIAEVAPVGSPSLFEELDRMKNYSALEVYLALKGADSKVPYKLLEEHQKFVTKTGRTNAQPKKLDLDISANTQAFFSVDEGYDTGHCNYSETLHPGNSEFTWAWYWNIGNTKDFTAQQTYFPSNLNGTTGKSWYAGKSSSRWLGACNGSYIYGFPAFEFRAEYKNYLGQWSAAYMTQVEPYFWVRYSSFSSTEQWRVKLREIGYNVMLNREYAVAVAGNEPLKFEMGF